MSTEHWFLCAECGEEFLAHCEDEDDPPAPPCPNCGSRDTTLDE